MRIAEYLGKNVSIILNETPFKNWPVEKITEDELEEKLTSYTFNGHGLELNCDPNDNVSAIFLHPNKYGGFDESLFEISFSLSRKQVLEHFGTPSKSGEKNSSAILGDSGPWDLFTRLGYAIHVEYRTDSDRINLITLMRSDVIP